MATEKRNLTVVVNNSQQKENITENLEQNYQSNPFYEKLLKFRDLQNLQKKRFTVDDLFKLC